MVLLHPSVSFMSALNPMFMEGIFFKLGRSAHFNKRMCRTNTALVSAQGQTWRSYKPLIPASLQKIHVSVQVPIFAWNNALRGTWGISPPVKLESPYITFIVLVQRKTRPKNLKMSLNDLGHWRKYESFLVIVLSSLIRYTCMYVEVRYLNMLFQIQWYVQVVVLH